MGLSELVSVSPWFDPEDGLSQSGLQRIDFEKKGKFG
jgi:hypothetical protein